jgi:L-threonylcarbamoyladenylate synthase
VTTPRPRQLQLDIERAVEILQAGGLAVIPTDTVYGIAAALAHPRAIERIYEIKGRDRLKAIPILVSDPEQVASLSHEVGPTAERLARHFWPGALTIVVEASDRVPPEALSGGMTVGLRMPDNETALEIIRRCGGALAVTSANPSGKREARTAAEARQSLGDLIDFIVDGGTAPGGVPSTVVDATIEPFRILRQGAITRDELQSVLQRTR